MIIKMYNPLQECELKFDSSGSGEFEGYASVFGKIDAVQDTIEKGAFSKTIKSKKTIPMFINHDSYQIPVGKYTHLKEDNTGLLVTGKIDMNHKDGPSLYSALKEQTMGALSIGFRIRKGGAYEDENTGARVLTDIDLKEISPVNFPADEFALIHTVKSEIDAINSLKDAEKFLRELGLSKSEATAIVSRIRGFHRSDSDKLADEITKAQLTTQLVDFINKL